MRAHVLNCIEYAIDIAEQYRKTVDARAMRMPNCNIATVEYLIDYPHIEAFISISFAPLDGRARPPRLSGYPITYAQ